MALQSYEPVFHILRYSVPGSEHLLGRIVSSRESPTSDYTPKSLSGGLAPDVFRHYLLGVQHDDAACFTAQAARNDKLWAKLKGALSLSVESAQGGTIELKSPRITTRRLRLEGDYFQKLKAIPEVRREILAMCPFGGRAYLIVGTMSFHTAELKRTGTRRNNSIVSGTLPIGTLAGAAAMSTAVPLALENPELGAQRSHSNEWTTQSRTTAVGENGDAAEDAEEIFAVAYREISRDWQGFGNDVKLNAKRPEYRGGQHFGDDEESDSDKDEENEEMEELAARDLILANSRPEAFEASSVIFNPAPELAFD
jgi:hypothetical protein